MQYRYLASNNLFDLELDFSKYEMHSASFDFAIFCHHKAQK